MTFSDVNNLINNGWVCNGYIRKQLKISLILANPALNLKFIKLLFPRNSH